MKTTEWNKNSKSKKSKRGNSAEEGRWADARPAMGGPEPPIKGAVRWPPLMAHQSFLERPDPPVSDDFDPLGEAFSGTRRAPPDAQKWRSMK
jgi:hypothetical protein